LDLLHSLFDTIHIPNIVYQEIVIAGKGKVGSEEVAGAAWIERRAVKNKSAVARFIRDDLIPQPGNSGSSPPSFSLDSKNDWVLVHHDRV